MHIYTHIYKLGLLCRFFCWCISSWTLDITHIYVCLFTHSDIFLHTHTCVCKKISLCVKRHTNMCALSKVQLLVHLHRHLQSNPNLHVCVYIYIYIYIHMYTHICIYIFMWYQELDAQISRRTKSNFFLVFQTKETLQNTQTYTRRSNLRRNIGMLLYSNRTHAAHTPSQKKKNLNLRYKPHHSLTTQKNFYCEN